jgi:hypothetical protein
VFIPKVVWCRRVAVHDKSDAREQVIEYRVSSWYQIDLLSIDEVVDQDYLLTRLQVVRKCVTSLAVRH